MNGQAEFNEVFFSDARVPADGLVGEDGQGWAAAITTLAYERAGVTQPHSLVTPDPGAEHGQLDRRVGDLVRQSHDRSGSESPDVTSARFELLGPAGTLAGADAPAGGIVQEMALTVPSASIASGSDEIQRNILGERALGLPKVISVDRDIPFREVRSSSR
jgi:acyl-CoA dehydrogenase